MPPNLRRRLAAGEISQIFVAALDKDNFTVQLVQITAGNAPCLIYNTSPAAVPKGRVRWAAVMAFWLKR